MDVAQSKIEHAAESTLAKIIGRWVTPVLVTALGTLILGMLSDIRGTQSSQGTQLKDTQSSVSSLDTKLGLLNAKVDYSVLQQIDTLNHRVQLLEDRANVLRDKGQRN